MYCKPSRNAEPKRKRQLGINLFPVLVSVPLLALLAFVSFIFTNAIMIHSKYQIFICNIEHKYKKQTVLFPNKPAFYIYTEVPTMEK